MFQYNAMRNQPACDQALVYNNSLLEKKFSETYLHLNAFCVQVIPEWPRMPSLSH